MLNLFRRRTINRQGLARGIRGKLHATGIFLIPDYELPHAVACGWREIDGPVPLQGNWSWIGKGDSL